MQYQYVTLDDIKNYLDDEYYGVMELLCQYGYEEDGECTIDTIVKSISWQFMLMEDPKLSDYQNIRLIVKVLDEFVFLTIEDFKNNPKYNKEGR